MEKKWERTRFSARFLAVDEAGNEIKDGFSALNMLKLYGDVRAVLPNCRLSSDNPDGHMVVSVENQEEIAIMQAMTSFGGVRAKRITRETQYWGRIYGVPAQISDEEVLDALKSEGVTEVQRESYFVTEQQKGIAKRVKVRSLRVRLRFSNIPPAKVNIGFPELFPVTLIAETALQCFHCHQFNHKAEDCNRRENPLCRRCARPGHQAWQCSSTPNCINCGRPHSARDPRCPVLAKYNEARKVRQISQIVCTAPDIRLDFSAAPPLEIPTQMTEQSSAPVNTGATQRSFAQVVSLRQADRDLCRIPVPQSQKMKKPSTAASKIATHIDEQATGSSAGLKNQEASLGKIWRKIKTELQTVTAHFPQVAAIIALIDMFVQSLLGGTSSTCNNV